jgi:integrase
VSKSTASSRVRKQLRPAKPYPEFPLTPHASGAWQKKINGKLHYFHRWGRVVRGSMQRLEGDGWELALALYEAQVDDIQRGRKPRARIEDGKVVTTEPAGFTLAHLCNEFLTAKTRKLEAREIGGRIFAEYRTITDLLIDTFGDTRHVDDLTPDDFEKLRAVMAKRWGPVRMLTETVRVKSVFKYALEKGRIEKPINYGPEFKPPTRSVLRRHRAQSGGKMLQAAEVRKLIEAADAPMRAMIYLGINCAMGNTDCANLKTNHLDLDRGWLVYPRPKTGIERRSPLWPESIAAIREVLGDRQEGHVFLNERGTPLIRVTEKNHTDLVSVRFAALLKRVKLARPGIGFYGLRHSHRTAADAARDPVACNLIMGHVDDSMAATYREEVDDARLEAVVKIVADWLKGGAA